MEDPVDRIVEAWMRERPDLDPTPMAIVGRITRLSRELDRELQRVFVAAGVGRGEFDVLATLRRAGAPYRLAPGALLEAMMVTSGAVTKRVDRLAAAGLVTREPDPHDRRGVLVGLTDDGLAFVDRVVAEHLQNEERLLAGLSARKRETLASLLRELGESVRAASAEASDARRTR